MTNIITSSKGLIVHPVRRGVIDILEKHFSPEIVKRFVMEFEGNFLSRDYKDVWAQKKYNVHYLEIRYVLDSGLHEYVCDINTGMTKKRAEAHLLRMITDKVADGKFGADWIEENGRISLDITSRKYETHEEEVTNGS